MREPDNTHLAVVIALILDAAAVVILLGVILDASGTRVRAVRPVVLSSLSVPS
jgi:hypothetical protein